MRARRESWAPGKAARHAAAGVRDEYATVFLPWEYVALGWPAFAEVHAQRAARQWALLGRWSDVECLVWYAGYSGAFLTLRRIW